LHSRHIIYTCLAKYTCFRSQVRAVEQRLVARDDFDKHATQQAKINTVLCSEFSTARWIWKTGRTEKARRSKI
jgi:hypothetical protein